MKAFPARLADPAGFLLLQLLDACFIVPNGLQLSAEHDGCEDGEEQRFKAQEQQENYCRRRAERRALLPLGVDARNELQHDKYEGMDGQECYVKLNTQSLTEYYYK